MRNASTAIQTKELYSLTMIGKKGQLKKNIKPDTKEDVVSYINNLKMQKKVAKENPNESFTRAYKEQLEKEREHKHLKEIKEGRKSNASNYLPTTIVKPNHLLPGLHDKTHFKAAEEYSLINKDTHRSLNDKHREIEKFIEEAHLTREHQCSKIPVKNQGM